MKYVVQYGAMRSLGVFSYSDSVVLRSGSRVIVQTPRGQEIGTLRCQVTPEILAKLDSGLLEDRIIRTMTESDEKVYQNILQHEPLKRERCQQIISDLGMVMELVRVEQIFGGERLIIYYTADGRVDFRELIKVLAIEFQIRIEMRQINVREEMRLLTNIGDCGREVCCSCYLRETPTVLIKMAKLQKVTLDPGKISGHCGRLKCCLHYEYDCYLEESGKNVKPPK